MSVRKKALTSFDSVVLAAVVVDLEQYVGGRIVRIVQPSPDEIVLDIRRERSTGRLLISIHPQWARVHLTTAGERGTLSAFAQMLRRRLDRGVLRSAHQPPFERTLTLDVGTDDGRAALIIEIMGRHSNLILVENSHVAGSLKMVPRSKSSVREVRPGAPFVPAPRDRPSPFELTPELLADILSKARVPLSRALASSVLGMGPTLAAELVFRSGLRPDESAAEHDDAAVRLWPQLQELVTIVKDRQFAPTIYADDTGATGFTPFPFRHLESIRHQSAATMSEAVDAVLTAAGSLSLLEDARGRTIAVVDAALEKNRRTEDEVTKSLVEAQEAEDLRAQGELLLAYASQVEPGAVEATIAGYNGNPLVVRLDPTLSPVENAQRLFKRYGKLRDARPALQTRQQRLAADRSFLQDARAMALKATTKEDLDDINRELMDEGFLRAQKLSRTREKSAGPRTFKLAGGTVLVGRTTRENDRVTFTLASPEDVWLHARGVGGSHVVLRSEGRRPSQQLIAQAASIAAHFSQARESGQVPVDYTLRKYVRKPKGAKPGLVTYEKEKTIFVKPGLPVTR
jgi:predicted ribosome quality control (RQC) complex YloA/Tae2 family protein